MPIALDSKEAQAIRHLVPVTTIPLTQFERLCAKIEILSATAGSVLFKRGDATDALLYLLQGEVSLQAFNIQIDVINAENYNGRFALAHHHPRKIDAVALTPVRYVRLQSAWLNLQPLLINQEDLIYMAGNPDDWMTTLLHSPIFESLPPANLQKFMMGLEEIQVPKGTVVLKQGEAGDYYYLIKQGQCMVSRRPNPNAREIKLAQLRTCDTFGEDALLTDTVSNVAVTALTDLLLLRLDKEKFTSLIKLPVLKYIEANELEAALQAGAFIVDIRPQDDYLAQHVEGSINAPFFSLLMQLKTFERKKMVIVVCSDGKASAAAAFLLLRHKFNAKILRHGLRGLSNVLLGRVVQFVQGVAVRKTFLDEESILETAPKEKTLTLEQLVQEHEKLKAALQTLQQHYTQLQHEKALSDAQCQALLRQVEQLQALQSLQ